MHFKVDEYVAKQFLLTASLCLGHIITGYSTGWSSPVLEKLLDREQTPLSDVMTSLEASWTASFYMIGIVIAPALIAFLANIIGRKPCIIISSLLIMLGYTLLTIALNTTWIYSGQVIKGLGVAGTVLINCMYVGEIASPNIRGIIMGATGVCQAFGVVLVYAIGPFISYREVSYVSIMFNVVHLFSCAYYLPESPVFYVIKDNEEAAKTVLQELGRSKDIDTELKTMIEARKQDSAKANIQLFKIKSNWMALIINTVLLSLNQGGGVLCVLFYASIIFRSSASSVAPEIATIILGATQLAGSIITPFYVDKYGRKTLLLLSSSSCSVSLLVLGVYYYLELVEYSSISSIRWLPLFTLVSYLFSFSFGVSGVPITLLGETFQPSFRSVGSAIATTTGCLAGLASTASFNYLINAMGSHITFWIYAAFNVFGFFFTLFVVPETKGKSLMEIEAMLR